MRAGIFAGLLSLAPFVASAGPYECKQSCGDKANQCIRECWARYVPGYEYPFYDKAKEKEAVRGTECVMACGEQGNKCREHCTDPRFTSGDVEFSR